MGHTILYSGQTDQHHRSRVAMIMNRKVEKSLLDWKPISDRLIKARFNFKFAKLTVIVCYAPTEDAEEEIKNEYEKLEEEIRTGMMYSWWWETSTQGLERTILEEKGSWAPKALDASVTRVRDF